MMLYHYCSNESFLKIIQNQEIRLTELSMSNDSMEGLWVREIFKKAWVKFGGEQSHESMMLSYLDTYLQSSSNYGFCMSKKGDLLSQWRGYAADATGVSIGFDNISQSKKSFERRAHVFTIEQIEIEYVEEIQINNLKPFIKKILENSDEDGLEKSWSVGGETDSFVKFLSFYPLIEAAFSMKTIGFKEEEEVRYISSSLGHDSRVSGESTHLDFFARDTHIVPFIPMTFIEFGMLKIKNIILGPRNSTPKPVITSLLEKHGFFDVAVDVSQVSYRKNT